MQVAWGPGTSYGETANSFRVLSTVMLVETGEALRFRVEGFISLMKVERQSQRACRGSKLQ